MSKRSAVAATPYVQARKRSNSAGAAAAAANPLLAILPKIEIDVERFEYTTHHDWDDMQSVQGCKKIFKFWYDKFGSTYKHERHAFNHLCKHYDGFKLKRIDVLVNGELCTVLWAIEIRDLPSRVYQILEGRPELIATVEQGATCIEKAELEPLKQLIEKLCA